MHYNDEDTYNLWLTVGESWRSELDVNNLTTEHTKRISEETGEIIILI